MNKSPDLNNMSAEELRELVLNLQSKVTSLQGERDLLLRQLFGRKSEKRLSDDENSPQQQLFNEIEVGAITEQEELTEIEREAPLLVKAYQRKKPGRRPLPDHLPRREIVHDLSDDQKFCRNGHPLKHIGSDISERLTIIPMQLEVERHIRHKYVCPACSKSSAKTAEAVAPDAEPEVITAPGSPALIPGSIATPSLLAHLLVSKFCDGLPFYRIERILSRFGIDLSRATMSFWAIRVARSTLRLRKLLFDELRSAGVIHIDETKVQVLKEPGRKASTDSYMWVYHARTDAGRVTLFEYRPGRGGEFLPKRLRGFKGTFVSDNYSGYNSLAVKTKDSKPADIIGAGCWAHLRRKFYEASTSGSANADWFLEQIGHLYRIEKNHRDATPQKRRKARRQHSAAIVAGIRERADELWPGTLQGSPLGKALKYLIKGWPRFIVFLENGDVPIDNNPVENEIRPFVIGRKNWLFNDSQKGASASAFFYSLIQTAKANGHEPYWYLRYLLEKMPAAGRDTEKLRSLLPLHLSPDLVDAHFGREK